MKLKKFFAGVLAAAMMLTVGATAAFADDPISVPDSSDAGYKGAKVIVADDDGHAYLSLTKVLDVKEGMAPDKMTFDFTVAGTSATGSVDFKRTDNDNSAAFTAGEYKRTFNIDLMQVLGANAEKVGAYTYTISETDPQIPGIKQVRSSLTMIVTVINKNGELNQGYGYIVALRDNGTKVPANEAFKNSYGDSNLQSLELSKTIHGSLGNLQDTFTFNVKFSAKEGVNASQYKGVSVTNGTEHIAGLNNTVNDGLLELGKTYTVTLGHDNSITFGNLPEGVTYEISENTTTLNAENKYVNGEYTVSVSDTKGTSRVNETAKTLVAVNEANTHFGIKGAITTGTNPVAFHNTKEGSPDMGVVLDNAPYIAMLAIVVIGGVALMLNKRRRDEE